MKEPTYEGEWIVVDDPEQPPAFTIADGIAAATAGVRAFTKASGVSHSKHTAGHAGEKQRRKERTRAKNRTAQASRRANRTR